MDEFSQIPVPVTDFCETGITDKDVMVGNSSNGSDNNTGACVSNNPMPITVIRGHVERLLRGTLLVGYKVEDSLKALGLSHPWTQVRDIAYFPPFLHNKVVGGSTSVVTVRSLDELSEEFLRQPLRPLGDRSRPLDLCLSGLALYESFRDQWERQSLGQQQDVFVLGRNQQKQVHQSQRRMIPPSPSTMMQSPQLSPTQYYGQQPCTATYSAPMMMAPPPQLQRQVLMPEQQQQYSDVQSRTNLNSSSWFPWGKQQPQQQNSAVVASQTLSPLAIQVLREDSCEPEPSFSENHFFPIATHSGGSAFSERRSSYDGSAYAGGSEFSRGTSDVFTAENSSMFDEASSAFSGDRASANPSESNCESSPMHSSWFRFVSKKSKDHAQFDTSSHCETMAAVQEMEVLTDDDMLPPPTNLFPASQDSENDGTASLQKTSNIEGKEDTAPSDSSSMSPQMPRSWFAFRKSPLPKDRSRSPSSSFSESTLEDLSIAAQPEGLADAATEASIEITLSIPASGESDDTIGPLAVKHSTTSLSCRPSSSWFAGFRRSKSSGSKSGSLNANCLGKGSVQTEMPYHPDLKMAPTEATAVMDDDWLQEIMSQSTGNTEEFEPWMNGTGDANPGEIAAKTMSASRGQASWFGFKRSKVAASSNKSSRLTASMDATNESAKAEALSEDDTWDNSPASGDYWLPGEANPSISLNIEHHNDNNMQEIFHTRSRLPTESTIPSVTTDEPLEEDFSHSESYSNDLDFDAAQSFNFLKI
jgi:hypothetical protein